MAFFLKLFLGQDANRARPASVPPGGLPPRPDRTACLSFSTGDRAGPFRVWENGADTRVQARIFLSTQAMFRPRVCMVRRPSSSFSTSPGFSPMPKFQ